MGLYMNELPIALKERATRRSGVAAHYTLAEHHIAVG
jgi:hypothetical protein